MSNIEKLEFKSSRDNDVHIVTPPVPNLFDDPLAKLSKQHSESPFIKFTSQDFGNPDDKTCKRRRELASEDDDNSLITGMIFPAALENLCFNKPYFLDELVTISIRVYDIYSCT